MGRNWGSGRRGPGAMDSEDGVGWPRDGFPWVIRESWGQRRRRGDGTGMLTPVLASTPTFTLASLCALIKCHLRNSLGKKKKRQHRKTEAETRGGGGRAHSCFCPSLSILELPCPCGWHTEARTAGLGPWRPRRAGEGRGAAGSHAYLTLLLVQMMYSISSE